MLELSFNNETGNRQYDRRFFETLILSGLKELKFDERKTGLSVNLVSDPRMRKLNKTHRGKDVPTDVLSFPIYKKPRNAKTAKNDILELGDIFISLSVAAEKAKKEKKSMRAELAFLTIHGLLHLCGYDHEESKTSAKEMFKVQDKILNKFSL